MRERLVKLLKRWFTSKADCAEIANYLLANGVVLLPCKVGDVVYLISLDKEIIEYIVMGVSLYPNGLFVEIRDGEQTFSIAVKKIHFTREEAERALRKEDEGTMKENCAECKLLNNGGKCKFTQKRAKRHRLPNREKRCGMMTVKDICENIEKEYRLLAKLTGMNYITGTFLDEAFSMWSDEINGKRPIEIYKRGEAVSE